MTSSPPGFGISDFVGGLASRRVHALRVVVVSYPLTLVMMVPLALAVGGSAGQAALLIGALAGVLVGVAILWFYLALAEGPMSVVSPLTALLVAGLPLATGIALGERPGPLALVGAGLAVVAVVLVSREERAAVDHAGSPLHRQGRLADGGIRGKPSAGTSFCSIRCPRARACGRSPCPGWRRPRWWCRCRCHAAAPRGWCTSPAGGGRSDA
ncbi:MAG TPA: EamA family transporter [Pseudonocardiaceae bacterium]|nr:EamA family transporter [Pseudonocardiaceae bacterium]